MENERARRDGVPGSAGLLARSYPGAGHGPEYGDYECPYCGAVYPIVKELQRRLSARLRFVFRNFPLATVHPLAQQAAEAADAQGRYWPVHDVLFEHQDALTDEALLGYSRALDLDTTRFRDELRQHQYAARVLADVAGRIDSGVSGTPTFYINEVRHDTPYNFESLLEAFNAATRGRS